MLLVTSLMPRELASIDLLLDGLLRLTIFITTHYTPRAGLGRKIPCEREIFLLCAISRLYILLQFHDITLIIIYDEWAGQFQPITIERE